MIVISIQCCCIQKSKNNSENNLNIIFVVFLTIFWPVIQGFNGYQPVKGIGGIGWVIQDDRSTNVVSINVAPIWRYH